MREGPVGIEMAVEWQVEMFVLFDSRKVNPKPNSENWGSINKLTEKFFEPAGH